MKKRYVIGMDVGGTLVKISIVGRHGELLKSYAIETGVHRGPEDFVARISREVKMLHAEVRDSEGQIVGIGIGVAGKILQQEGIILFSPNLMSFNEYPLGKELSARTKLPVVMDNDANAFGIGEHWLGAGSGFDNWLGITLGTGVGGVLILDGRRWLGDDIGFVAEIGHTIVFPDGPLCNCGKRGCLEAVASGSALVKGARQVIEKDGVSPLLSEAYADGKLTPELINQAATKGDEVAGNLFNMLGRALGIAISNVFNLLGITTCIIGGGVSEAWENFIPSVWEALEEVNSMVDLKAVRIKKAVLGSKAATFGAAKIAWQEFNSKQ